MFLSFFSHASSINFNFKKPFNLTLLQAAHSFQTRLPKTPHANASKATQQQQEQRIKSPQIHSPNSAIIIS